MRLWEMRRLDSLLVGTVQDGFGLQWLVMKGLALHRVRGKGIGEFHDGIHGAFVVGGSEHQIYVHLFSPT